MFEPWFPWFLFFLGGGGEGGRLVGRCTVVLVFFVDFFCNHNFYLIFGIC